MKFNTIITIALAFTISVSARPLSNEASSSSNKIQGGLQSSDFTEEIQNVDLEKRGKYKSIATWYRQDGTTGSCGRKYSDSDKVIAVPPAYAGKHCFETVTIKYKSKTIKAVVADTCPSCQKHHIDLSRAAFHSLADFSLGEIDIQWWFNN